jgi:hypothetical protein
MVAAARALGADESSASMISFAAGGQVAVDVDLAAVGRDARPSLICRVRLS